MTDFYSYDTTKARVPGYMTISELENRNIPSKSIIVTASEEFNQRKCFHKNFIY